MRSSGIIRQVLRTISILLLLVGCRAPAPTAIPVSPAATSTPNPPFWEITPWSRSVYPTPVLTPAATFVDGQSQVPEGQVLFIESWQSTAVTDERCGVMLIDEPTYRYSGGRLSGFVLHPTSNASRVLVGKGNSFHGASSQMLTVNHLPYAIPNRNIAIHAVNAQGAAVVKIEGNTVWLQPGQEWQRKVEERFFTDCIVTRTSRLTNYGLLDDSQVSLDDYRPGMVVPALSCTHYQPFDGGGQVWDIEVAPDGKVWAATSNGAALFDPRAESWTTYTAQDGLVENTVTSVTSEPDGSVWFTTWNGTVSHFDGTRWTLYTADDGLVYFFVNRVSVAPDGCIWFATLGGASKWNRETGAWTSYTQADGLFKNDVKDVLFTVDGKIWLAMLGGVSYMTPGRSPDELDTWHIYPQSTELWHNHTTGYDVAAVSNDGKIWFGGQRYFDPGTQTWVQPAYDGPAYDLAVDESGGLWIATDRGAVYIAEPDPLQGTPDFQSLYNTTNGLAGDDIRSLVLEGEDTIWFGTKGTVARCTIEK